jgi:hypothetical protein
MRQYTPYSKTGALPPKKFASILSLVGAKLHTVAFSKNSLPQKNPPMELKDVCFKNRKMTEIKINVVWRSKGDPTFHFSEKDCGGPVIPCGGQTPKTHATNTTLRHLPRPDTSVIVDGSNPPTDVPPPFLPYTQTDLSVVVCLYSD